MKLLTPLDLYKTEIDRLVLEYIPNSVSKEDLDNEFNKYVGSAYADYQKYHSGRKVTWLQYRKNTGHNELCSWCNLHACIRDLYKKNDELLCLNHKLLPRDEYADCSMCLKETTWYKRLI